MLFLEMNTFFVVVYKRITLIYELCIKHSFMFSCRYLSDVGKKKRGFQSRMIIDLCERKSKMKCAMYSPQSVFINRHLKYERLG